MAQYDVKKIIISDDLFVANLNRIEKIIELLEMEGLLGKIKFHVTGRANLMSEEVCKKLKAMNVESIDFGLESGSDKILSYLKIKYYLKIRLINS